MTTKQGISPTTSGEEMREGLETADVELAKMGPAGQAEVKAKGRRRLAAILLLAVTFGGGGVGTYQATKGEKKATSDDAQATLTIGPAEAQAQQPAGSYQVAALDPKAPSAKPKKTAYERSLELVEEMKSLGRTGKDQKAIDRLKEIGELLKEEADLLSDDEAVEISKRIKSI